MAVRTLCCRLDKHSDPGLGWGIVQRLKVRYSDDGAIGLGYWDLWGKHRSILVYRHHSAILLEGRWKVTVFGYTLFAVEARRERDTNMMSFLKVTRGIVDYDNAVVLPMRDALCRGVRMLVPAAVGDTAQDYLWRRQRMLESLRTLWKTECECQKAVGQ